MVEIPPIKMVMTGAWLMIVLPALRYKPWLNKLETNELS